MSLTDAKPILEENILQIFSAEANEKESPAESRKRVGKCNRYIRQSWIGYGGHHRHSCCTNRNRKYNIKAMPKDILLSTDFSLRIENGDFVIGESTYQHQRDLLFADKGEFKEELTTGVGSRRYLEKALQIWPELFVWNTLPTVWRLIQSISMISWK